MRKGLFILIAGFVIVGSFTACLKDKFDFDKLTDPEWGAEFAAPLISSFINIEDLVNRADSNIKIVEDADRFVTLIYTDRVLSILGGDFVSIPDKTTDSSFNFTLPVSFPPGQTVQFNTDYLHEMTSSRGEQIDSIFFKGGTLNFTIQGNLRHNAKITLTIPAATKNGVAFSEEVNYTYQGTTPVILNHTVDLTGYKLTLFHSGGVNNQVLENVVIDVTSLGGGGSSQFSISINESFNNLKFSRIFGRFGQQVTNFDDNEVIINFFKKYLSGEFEFEEPRLRLNITNAYGVPLMFNFKSIEAFSNANPSVTLTSSTILPDIYVKAPDISQIGQSVVTSKLFDISNSNVDDVTNISPSSIKYSFDALSNPFGGDSLNFLFDTSRFFIDLMYELPLHGTARNFELQDTIKDFKIEDVKNFDAIQFKIYISNEFPVEANVQVYFLDDAYNFLDSLLIGDQQIVLAASPGPPPGYRVASPVVKTTESTIDKGRLKNLEKTARLLIKAVIATSNGGNSTVKIYGDYDINVRLGMRAKMNSDGLIR